MTLTWCSGCSSWCRVFSHRGQLEEIIPSESPVGNFQSPKTKFLAHFCTSRPQMCVFSKSSSCLRREEEAHRKQ